MEKYLEEMTKPGTRACGLLCALIMALFVLLLFTVGFWAAVAVTAAGAFGWVLGSVTDKEAALKKLLDRIIPRKDS